MAKTVVVFDTQNHKIVTEITGSSMEEVTPVVNTFIAKSPNKNLDCYVDPKP